MHEELEKYVVKEADYHALGMVFNEYDEDMSLDDVLDILDDDDGELGDKFQVCEEYECSDNYELCRSLQEHYSTGQYVTRNAIEETQKIAAKFLFEEIKDDRSFIEESATEEGQEAKYSAKDVDVMISNALYQTMVKIFDHHIHFNSKTKKMTLVKGKVKK